LLHLLRLGIGPFRHAAPLRNFGRERGEADIGRRILLTALVVNDPTETSAGRRQLDEGTTECHAGYVIVRPASPRVNYVIDMTRRLHVLEAPAIAIAGLTLALSSSSNAQQSLQKQQPPRERCVTVTKREYDNARKKSLLRNRFGEYLRTGRVLRRRYWYCQL
jgi:hypothetical protein